MISFDGEAGDYGVIYGVRIWPDTLGYPFAYRDDDNDPILKILKGTLVTFSVVSLEGLFGSRSFIPKEVLPSSDHFDDRIPYDFTEDNVRYTNPLLSAAKLAASGLFHKSALKHRRSMYREHNVLHTHIDGRVRPSGSFVGLHTFNQSLSEAGFEYEAYTDKLYDEYSVVDGVPTVGSTDSYHVYYSLEYIISKFEDYFSNNDSLSNYATYFDTKQRHLTHEISNFLVGRSDDGNITISYHRKSHFYHDDSYHCRYDFWRESDNLLTFSFENLGRVESNPVITDGVYSFPSIAKVRLSRSETNIVQTQRKPASCSGWDDPISHSDNHFSYSTTLCGAVTNFDDPVSANAEVIASLRGPLPIGGVTGPLSVSMASYFEMVLQSSLRAAAFHSTSDAIEPFLRQLTSNWLENLSSLPKLAPYLDTSKTLFTALRDLRRGKLSSSAKKLTDVLTNAQLVYAFELAPTFKDAQEVAAISRDIDFHAIEQLLSPSILYGSAVFTFEDNLLGEVTLTTRSKVRAIMSESALWSSIFSVESIGLLPRLSTMWDLVPFSFVIDWFVDIGSKLDNIDKSVFLLAFDFPLIVHSYTLEGNFSDELMDHFGWQKSDDLVNPTFRLYTRELSRTQPQYRDSKIYTGSQTSLPYKTAGSLAYQVLT